MDCFALYRFRFCARPQIFFFLPNTHCISNSESIFTVSQIYANFWCISKMISKKKNHDNLSNLLFVVYSSELIFYKYCIGNLYAYFIFFLNHLVLSSIFIFKDILKFVPRKILRKMKMSCLDFGNDTFRSVSIQKKIWLDYSPIQSSYKKKSTRKDFLT